MFLLGILVLILFIDFATFRRRGTRVFLVELVVFSLGGVLIAFPQISIWIAGWMGIGRGVDVILYLTIIWLVRESILNRHARWQETVRVTELVRVVALQSARKQSSRSSAGQLE